MKYLLLDRRGRRIKMIEASSQDEADNIGEEHAGFDKAKPIGNKYGSQRADYKKTFFKGHRNDVSEELPS